VSNTRVGEVAAKPLPVGKYSLMSASRCVGAKEKNHTSPAGDTGAMTALGTVWPAT
jgi:hypothetical protein